MSRVYLKLFLVSLLACFLTSCFFSQGSPYAKNCVVPMHNPGGQQFEDSGAFFQEYSKWKVESDSKMNYHDYTMGGAQSHYSAPPLSPMQSAEHGRFVTSTGIDLERLPGAMHMDNNLSVHDKNNDLK